MSKQRTEKRDTGSAKAEKTSDNQDGSNPMPLTTKLERRRRIEDLSEERRLREESSVF